MQKITPFLWFDHQAEEAAKFYVSIFRKSKIVSVNRYGDAGARASGRPKGSVMTVAFELEGQPFVALNGGPAFTFSPAVSFVVNCRTQQEIDDLWEKLSENGEKMDCGWLKDRYGVSWQIVPAILGELVSDPDAEKSDRVMQALMQMKKIDAEVLKKASKQSSPDTGFGRAKSA